MIWIRCEAEYRGLLPNYSIRVRSGVKFSLTVILHLVLPRPHCLGSTTFKIVCETLCVLECFCPTTRFHADKMSIPRYFLALSMANIQTNNRIWPSQQGSAMLFAQGQHILSYSARIPTLLNNSVAFSIAETLTSSCSTFIYPTNPRNMLFLPSPFIPLQQSCSAKHSLEWLLGLVLREKIS